MHHADFAIIGSGQGGVALATRLAQDGHNVYLFERRAWGGTCVNTGCIPSKTFLASAHAAADARRAAALGVHAEVRVDFPAVMQRVRDSIQPESLAYHLHDAGVHLVPATAEFVAQHTIRANDTLVEADTIVINTGKSPAVPPIPGLADTPYLTYQTIWDLTERPDKLLILGGGYTGLELAQGMQRLGCQVHVLEVHDRVAADEERDVSQALQAALAADGVTFHLSSQVRGVQHVNGLFMLDVDTCVDPLIGNALLLAAGRRPDVEALNLAHWGIAQDDAGHVQVDEQFRTTVDGVYAIGDVTGQPAFTHVSWEDHRRLYAIWQGKARRRGDRVLGYAFFTAPQVGRVGLTLPQAMAHGYDARAVTLPLKKVSRAAATGRTDGFYRLVVDQKSESILGATLVAPQAAELVHVILALMEAGATWRVLERAQHIHPAYAEDLPTLARQLMA
ncbi:MAG: FAD-dependent oxidoreductase [Anaerolineales bacterium]|nr:FAD-dependent oxidoreductase [Anaerolineales bacterium]